MIADDDFNRKQELIDKMIQEDFDFIMSGPDGAELLEDYLKNGFEGYSSYTLQELELDNSQREYIRSFDFERVV